MAKTMIEQNERGITINRALAWTMLVSVIGLIWWGGGTLVCGTLQRGQCAATPPDQPGDRDQHGPGQSPVKGDAALILVDPGFRHCCYSCCDFRAAAVMRARP